MSNQKPAQKTTAVPAAVASIISQPRPLFKDDKIDLPEISEGLYVFWWANGWDGSEASQEFLDRGAKEAKFVGPRNGTPHSTSFHEPGHKPLLETPHIALYVGKSPKVGQRIKQHLLPSTTSEKYRMTTGGQPVPLAIYSDEGPNFIYKRTSTCQFRAGMEYLYRELYFHAELNAMAQIKRNVLVSTLPVDADAGGFKHRFFTEDLLIGLLEPWFNLDGER